jgi:Mg2+-importing ATPase
MIDVSLVDLYAALRASPDGLTIEEAAKRREAQGPNLLQEPRRQRLILELLRRFSNPLVLILLFAASIAALTREQASFLIITTIVVLSVLIDFIQEHRAEAAAQALRQRVALRVRAIRDGRTQDLPAADLVTGDVVLLSAGALVPADCRLIEARDLFVNEALLTGEPYPAEKNASDAAAGTADAPTPDNGVFMGSSVVSGTARALVVAIGPATRLGAIAGALHKEPPPTAFTLGIRSFGMLIARLTVLLVMFVLLINLSFHRPLIESFLFALALAVGLTPELLPMIVSVTLARGAVRMSRAEVIVKRLSAIHDLGSMDILCSDKTGTLTEAHIKLVRQVDIEGSESSDVLQWAYANAVFETGLKSPLDMPSSRRRRSTLPPGARSTRCPSISSGAGYPFSPRKAAAASWSSRALPKMCSGIPRPIGWREAMSPSRLTTAPGRRRAPPWSGSAMRAFACWASRGARSSRRAIMPA